MFANIVGGCAVVYIVQGHAQGRQCQAMRKQ